MIATTLAAPLLAFALRTGVIIAPVGKSVPLETRYKVLLVSVLVSNTNVVRTAVGPAKDMRLEGRLPGTARVTMTGPNNEQWQVLVAVPR